ncbi:DNA-binding protein [Massilia sp. CMS3.1]|uniref:helix-turn-helix domain-containing transcriptional regulator n=1 Tax=Massilia sp. CMS3.1 TaxID=3373083 RepID=UPI003EE4FE67
MNTDHHDNPAASLATLEALSAWLAAAFESGDAAILTDAFAHAARAEGTTQLAAAAGIPQAELRHAFATGEMSMATTLAIMKVIDLHMPGAAH